MELHLTDVDLTVREGELATFREYNNLQRSVLPVFAKVGSRVVGRGSAVCVAPGLFVTARHVVADLDYNQIPAQWAVPFERLWLYIETDETVPNDTDGVRGGLLDVLFANPHSEVDLATLTVDMPGASADWLRPVSLALRMPQIGERVDCFGYDLATAEGDLNADLVELMLERNLSISIGRVIEQQPRRRLGGHHRTSPGFRTTAATPSGMSGGPVFDETNQVIGFNSGSTDPSEEHPQWDSFVSGVAAALELNFLIPLRQDGADRHLNVKDRTVHFVSLVESGVVACEAHPSFDVDAATGMAGYVTSSQDDDNQ